MRLEAIEALQNPAVIHWAGRYKPWEFQISEHFNRAYYDVPQKDGFATHPCHSPGYDGKIPVASGNADSFGKNLDTASGEKIRRQPNAKIAPNERNLNQEEYDDEKEVKWYSLTALTLAMCTQRMSIAVGNIFYGLAIVLFLVDVIERRRRGETFHLAPHVKHYFWAYASLP